MHSRVAASVSYASFLPPLTLCQIDFDESTSQNRFTVKPGVDPELDESEDAMASTHLHTRTHTHTHTYTHTHTHTYTHNHSTAIRSSPSPEKRTYNGLPDFMTQVARQELENLSEDIPECNVIYLPQVGGRGGVRGGGGARTVKAVCLSLPFCWPPSSWGICLPSHEATQSPIRRTLRSRDLSLWWVHIKYGNVPAAPATFQQCVPKGVCPAVHAGAMWLYLNV